MAKEFLKNGAEVIARDGNIVLARWDAVAHPWVTWHVDAEDNAYWGRYFDNPGSAIKNFAERTAVKGD